MALPGWHAVGPRAILLMLACGASAAGLGGCSLLPVQSTTTRIEVGEGDVDPIASGVEPWGAWRFSVAVADNGSWCEQLEAPSGGMSGCSSSGPDPAGAELGRQSVGGMFVSGPIGARVSSVRVAFGDGSTAIAPIVPAPGGMRFVVMPLPAAPVPETWQALDAAGAVISEGSFR